MIPENKVTEIFVMADDFCKFFDQMMENIPYQIKTNVNTIVTERCRKLR